MRAAPLLVIAVVFAIAVAAARGQDAPTDGTVTDPCTSFGTCSECVYDSFLPMTQVPINCFWCEDTGVCSSNASTCSVVRSPADPSPMCSDMQCSAAATTGNIYWCRAGTVTSAIFAFELLGLTVLYWFWMRTIQQLPWKYPDVNSAMDRVDAGASNRVELTLRKRAIHGCPICHVETGKTYAPGAVCYWCDIARYAFVPLVVGGSCSAVAIFALFALSLRPSFADPYYGVLLAVPHALYLLVAGSVVFTRRPVHGDSEQRPTTFFGLALTLRGRRLSSVFKIVSAAPIVAAAAAAESKDADGDDSQTTVSEAEQHIDTLQMLELDSSIPLNFREELEEAMRPDEYVVWREQPSSSKLVVEMRWLIFSFVIGGILGFFMLLVSGISTANYPAALLGPSSMRLVGFGILMFSLIMFAVTFASMKRLYVMTNRRFILVSSGIFASTHIITTELANVKAASIHGYQELGYTILKFAWEEKPVPGVVRRMPKSKMTEFAALVTIDVLLDKFGEYCESLDSAGEKVRMDQLRTTWRVHFTVLAIVCGLAPIVILSPRVLPSELAVTALLIVWCFALTFAQRGWRLLSTTTAHLNLAKAWGRFGSSGFSFSRLVPGALRHVRPSAIVKTVVQPQSPKADGSGTASPTGH